MKWMGVNAREPSLKGHVPKAIRETLEDQPENFIIFNRGLAVFAEAVDYDNREKVVTVTFADPQRHGIYDGGHTLYVILNRLANGALPEEAPEAFCRIEISTGVPPDLIADIVDARNTSRQVASKSLLNLSGSFSDLKDALGPRLSKLVAWKENEDAPVDVREVVALLTAMDRVDYDETKHPIHAYSGKEQCLKHFDVSPDCYVKTYPIAKDLLRLWDQIQASIPEQYNAAGGKFGRLTGCGLLKHERDLPVIGGTTRYAFPTGYLYPVFAAFRSMLEEENGVYAWGKSIDPSKLVRDGLANKIFMGAVTNSISYHKNPNKTGKDPTVWSLAYQIAENHYLRLK
jgi:hypothetical protein